MKSRTLFHLILITFLATFIPTMHAQTFSVLYAFTGGTDGAAPDAGVTIRGNALYGTTAGPICGTVYQLTNAGSNWLFSTLAALPNNCNPWSRPVFGPDGHLYSTSEAGGTYGQGTVFKLTPPVGVCRTVACYWTVSDLHDFSAGTDGQNPIYGDLIWDQQGNMYGTTQFGGTSQNCNEGCGIVYELTPSGNGYTESVLYSFSGTPDGSWPFAGLVLDNKGNLFGTTFIGGPNDLGTIFELSYVPGVGWTEHVLYAFKGTDDGGKPAGGVIFDSAGNLYGTTYEGGSGGGGTVFELSPSGDTWTFKLLYSFSVDSCGPAEALTMDGAGNLYGTTWCGGIYNNGNVFKLSNTEDGWVYTSLHDFTGGADGGGHVLSNVSIDADGTLYGTTQSGGESAYNCYSGCGVVWMIKP